jgi:hypothetical protein
VKFPVHDVRGGRPFPGRGQARRLRTTRATRPSSAMTLATVFTDSRQPRRISSMKTFGES